MNQHYVWINRHTYFDIRIDSLRRKKSRIYGKIFRRKKLEFMKTLKRQNIFWKSDKNLLKYVFK